jgi:hypothetical protein
MTVKLQIDAQSYHLRYLPSEDRLLLSVSAPENREFGVFLTRRLAHGLLKALAKMASERGAAGTGVNPALRDTILDFEHSKAVAAAVAQGTMREEQRDTQLTVPPKLMHQVTIAPKQDGSLSLVFDHPEQILTLAISGERLHMVIETFVRIAERADWDFPPLAGWLDPAKQVAGAPGRSLN